MGYGWHRGTGQPLAARQPGTERGPVEAAYKAPQGAWHPRESRRRAAGGKLSHLFPFGRSKVSAVKEALKKGGKHARQDWQAGKGTGQALYVLAMPLWR